MSTWYPFWGAALVSRIDGTVYGSWQELFFTGERMDVGQCDLTSNSCLIILGGFGQVGQFPIYKMGMFKVLTYRGVIRLSKLLYSIYKLDTCWNNLFTLFSMYILYWNVKYTLSVHRFLSFHRFCGNRWHLMTEYLLKIELFQNYLVTDCPHIQKCFSSLATFKAKQMFTAILVSWKETMLSDGGLC